MIAAHRPERIVSLLEPRLAFPATGEDYAGRHLRLSFHDVHHASAGLVPPGPADVATLLEFLRRWERKGPLLVHCHAGIGRSPATAFIAACLHFPQVDERRIMERLRQASPLVRPNETLIGLADAALGRQGRMTRAVVETGAGLGWTGARENQPFELPVA